MLEVKERAEGPKWGLEVGKKAEELELGLVVEERVV